MNVDLSEKELHLLNLILMDCEDMLSSRCALLEQARSLSKDIKDSKADIMNLRFKISKAILLY